MGLRLTITLGTLAVAALCLAAYEGWHLHRLQSWNETIARSRLSKPDPLPVIAGRRDPLELRFARAHALGLKEQTQAALDLYRQLESETSGRMRSDVQYNSANLYLEEALLLIGRDDPARALPLLELAKESYRDALRGGSNDWDVKYNLERTLRLAPELEEDAEALPSAPRAERAPTTMQVSPAPGGP